MINDWTIFHISDNKYGFMLDHEIIYMGTYTQCLIILGGLHSNMSLDRVIKLANEIGESIYG